MSSSVAGEVEAEIPSRGGGIEKIAIVAAKLIVTAGCFWYISRQIDFAQLVTAIPTLDFRWAALGILIAVAEIPLVALRWREILAALAALDHRMTYGAVTAITSIGVFFGQVLPSGAGEGVRAWFLVRLGGDWRNAVMSVVIDRGTGVIMLLLLGFVILLLPSALTALGGYRQPVLIGYGAALIAGVIGLLLVPWLAPLLRRWRYSRWLAALAEAVHRVLVGRRSPAVLGLALAIHALTILIVWSVGRAQGLALPLPDAAVLFTVVIGVVMVPISISGWGLREIAVISLLGQHGVAPETALLFSVCFGLVVAIASLPGALVWLLYSIAPARTSFPLPDPPPPSARSRASSTRDPGEAREGASSTRQDAERGQ
jgi:glycosyltransferase 2 family protein